MTKTQIINQIAKDRTVERMIENIAKTELTDDLKDLAQDIYISLMEKDEELLNELVDNKQIKFFISRMCMNNINSKNSPYYYLYIKNNLKHISIDEVKDKV